MCAVTPLRNDNDAVPVDISTENAMPCNAVKPAAHRHLALDQSTVSEKL